MPWPKGKPRKPIAAEVLSPTTNNLDSTPSKKESAVQDSWDGKSAEQSKDNPRETMFNELSERIENQRDQEIGLVAETPTEVPPETSEPKSEEEPKEELDKEVTEEEPKPEFLTVKIDGEEKQVLKTEVDEAGGLRAYQMEQAAAKRLQEAKSILKEIQEAKQKLLPSEEQKPKDAARMDPVELARTLQIGSPEEAAEAVRLLQNQFKMEPQQITRMLDERIDFKSAVKEFETEFKDIFSDPYLMTIATTMENNSRRDGDVRSYRDLYKEIGTNLRKWKDGMSRPATQEDKKAKKATVTNLPAANARQVPEPEEKEETTEDILNAMRKIRGQVVLNKE